MPNNTPVENHLYYGDNLDIMKRYIKDESVDLVYLDPPFNSAQDYNVLFKEQDGSRSAAQIKAFGDTWRWDQGAEAAYLETVERGGRISQALQGLRMFLGTNDMLAYLTMMAPRLIELRRIMKETASIFLHCDPTASHYLKIIMDAIFSPDNYLNEIIWQRTQAHNDAKTLGRTHDTILLYAKTNNFLWNKQYQAYDKDYIVSHYRYSDASGRKFRTDNLTAMGLSGGGYTYEWNGVTKVWRLPIEKMRELDEQGRIRYTRSGTAEYIRYLDEMPGMPMQDVWTDIRPINSQAQERLGYPTQKPEALLERIIKMATNEGDIVLDPFCGCGTAIAAAQKLKRHWIGIDITHIAISLIKARLRDAYGEEVTKTYKVIGEPTTLTGAIKLAEDDKYQFQWWALGLVGARPTEEKKGADKGIDGRLYFHDGDPKGLTKQVIFSVKGGHTDVSHVRDLRGVIEREGAQIGVLITLQEPGKPMNAEAASAGFYKSPWGSNHPRIQILTIKQLLEGKQVDMPQSRGMNQTFKRAPKAQREDQVTSVMLPGIETPQNEDHNTEGYFEDEE